jgi:hypothetical protein
VNSQNHIFWLLLCVTALLLLAILEMPYGYYQFLRIAVCGISLYSLYASNFLLLAHGFKIKVMNLLHEIYSFKRLIIGLLLTLFHTTVLLLLMKYRAIEALKKSKYLMCA